MAVLEFGLACLNHFSICFALASIMYHLLPGPLEVMGHASGSRLKKWNLCNCSSMIVVQKDFERILTYEIIINPSSDSSYQTHKCIQSILTRSFSLNPPHDRC